MKLFQLPNPTKFKNVQEFINALVEFSIQIVGAVAVLSIILSGYKYIVSGGDEKKTKEARDSIFNTVIGMIIVVSAYLLVKFVMVDFLKVESSYIGDWLTKK